MLTTSAMEYRADVSEESGTVYQKSKPMIKTEMKSLESSIVHVKKEVVDPADIQTDDLTIEDEDTPRTTVGGPRVQQFNVEGSLKQENLDDCVETKPNTCNLAATSRTEKPFPVVLYKVDVTRGMDHPPETNSSSLHNQERLLDVPWSMSGLKTEDGAYQCNSASPSSTDSSATPTKRTESPSGGKPFSCRLCTYTCAWNSQLSKHLRTHTGDRPYKCSLCKYSCAQKSHLNRHMKSHTGKKPYKCSLCKFSCAQKTDLNIHMRTHTGDKPYTCVLCAYSCTQKGHLDRHMRTHTGDKPYTCFFCAYSCTQKGHLDRHMTGHTGDRPYKCSLCSYSCAQKSHLKKHENSHW